MAEESQSADITTRLLEDKVISQDQVQIALKEQKRLQGQKTIGAILVDMGFISEGALGEVLNASTGTSDFDIKSTIIDARLVKKVPKEFAIKKPAIYFYLKISSKLLFKYIDKMSIYYIE